MSLDRDGALTLLRVPGPADGKAVEIAVSYPAPREVSGLALGSCDRVFVADTAHDRVLLVEPQCDARTWLTGFREPRGLTLDDESLWVSDSGHQRLQSLALPALEAHWAPVQGAAVTSVAVDAQQRVVYVDATAKTIRRFSRLGGPDVAFDQAVQASGRLAQPLFVAVGADGAVFVSDAVHNRVEVFDAQGVYLSTVAGPSGWLPGAVAVGADRLYVADAADGRILLFDLGGAWQGMVGGWRGPVTALALAASGDLYIKSSLDATYLRFVADAACVGSGQLLAGPFDAGVERAWERAWVEVDVPAGTRVTVDIAQAAQSTPGSAPSDWTSLPTLDALLAPLAPAAGSRRFVWLRVKLTSADSRAVPLLHQARVATEAEDLREFLPAVYRRNDPDRVLQRLVQLLRGEFLAVEEHIDAMPRTADPRFTAGGELPWLAQWLALELPRIASDDERRALIERAVAMFARRGAPASMQDFVELHTGIRPRIVEGFAQRRLWVLGQSSQLGFDTQLPPLDPAGVVVPDTLIQDCGDPLAGQEASEIRQPVIGRAVVGESGPLAAHQFGLPLLAEDAHRFCVVVDAHRVNNETTLHELRRIVDREKPTHTDYRIEVVTPDLRIGLQALVGVDTIVGGPVPGWQLGQRPLGESAHLMPADNVARAGEALLDGSMRLM